MKKRRYQIAARLAALNRLTGGGPALTFGHANMVKRMPVISRFLGIIIAMYWDDHSPPHFHAKYSGYEVTVDIETGVVEGRFPKRALHHVLEWHEIHKQELLENWDLCQRQEAPNPIDPLE